MTNRVLLCAAIAIATLALYAPVRALPFLLYDDPQYVTQNPPVKEGLTLDGVRWAFTSTHASNWHPLTWLSHMLDAELFGTSPVGPHVENGVLHALNACLVFLWLASLTGSVWRSAAVAALFALHPQRVESVAWVSERKDLLCASFALLALVAWTSFAKRGSRAGYALALAFMALGLLAKPMLVSLPLLLLVLDYWPLARGLRIAEKLPFVGLAVVSSLVTLYAQTDAITPTIDFADRIANALVALSRQLGRALWPADLAVLYPHPRDWPLGAALGSGAVVAALAALAFAKRRSAPYVAAGLLWFAIGLGPTLGLVQVGFQSSADRYTYLPQIGVWLALVWAAAQASALRHVRSAAQTLAIAACVAALLAFAVVTRVQLSYWSDDLALWQRALAVTDDNWFAHTQAGVELAARGRNEEARVQLAEATRLAPEWEPAQANHGFVLLRVGRPQEAIDALLRALSLDPSSGGPGERHLYLALALEQAGRTREAIAEYELHRTLAPLDPRAPEALDRLRATARP
ncbi:MAG: tetratricopeptide repeat protein [Myxococcota bacterium]